MFHVAYYVLMEVNAGSSIEAESKVSDLMPTTQELELMGKVRSKQWTVTELTTEDMQRFGYQNAK